jgi:hypothetical protein
MTRYELMLMFAAIAVIFCIAAIATSPNHAAMILGTIALASATLSIMIGEGKDGK